jgi:hypothetical protein
MSSPTPPTRVPLNKEGAACIGRPQIFAECAYIGVEPAPENRIDNRITIACGQTLDTSAWVPELEPVVLLLSIENVSTHPRQPEPVRKMISSTLLDFSTTVGNMFGPHDHLAVNPTTRQLLFWINWILLVYQNLGARWVIREVFIQGLVDHHGGILGSSKLTN